MECYFPYHTHLTRTLANVVAPCAARSSPVNFFGKSFAPIETIVTLPLHHHIPRRVCQHQQGKHIICNCHFGFYVLRCQTTFLRPTPYRSDAQSSLGSYRIWMLLFPCHMHLRICMCLGWMVAG